MVWERIVSERGGGPVLMVLDIVRYIIVGLRNKQDKNGWLLPQHIVLNIYMIYAVADPGFEVTGGPLFLGIRIAPPPPPLVHFL